MGSGGGFWRLGGEGYFRFCQEIDKKMYDLPKIGKIDPGNSDKFGILTCIPGGNII